MDKIAREEEVEVRDARRRNFAKYLRNLLILLNFFLLGASIACLAVGVWIVTEKKPLEYLVGTNLHSSAAYILIAVGSVAVLLSFLALVGALKQIKCLLIIYFVSLLLLFMMVVIAGTLGFVFKGQLPDRLKMSMINSLQFRYGQKVYKSDAALTEAWDFIQKKYSCCSVVTPEDSKDLAQASLYSFLLWYNSTWFQSHSNYPRERVPDSCCVSCVDLHARGYCTLSGAADATSEKAREICESDCPEPFEEIVDLDKCQGTSAGALLTWPDSEYLNTKGCYEDFFEEMKEVSIVLATLGIGVAILMIVCMLCAICLYCYAN